MAEKNSGKNSRPPEGRPFVKGQSGNPHGRPKGTPNRATRQRKEFFASLVESPTYRRNFRKAFLARSIDTQLEVLAWHYAKGKPATTIAANIEFDHASYLAAMTPDDE